MSDKAWIILGVVAVALVIVIGIFLYQKSKNDAEQINKDKLLALQAGLGGTVQQGYQQAGVGGWITSLLGSSSVTALAGGFGSGLASNYGGGK